LHILYAITLNTSLDADTVLTFKKRLDVCNEWGIQSWWSFL